MRPNLHLAEEGYRWFGATALSISGPNRPHWSVRFLFRVFVRPDRLSFSPSLAERIVLRCFNYTRRRFSPYLGWFPFFGALDRGVAREQLLVRLRKKKPRKRRRGRDWHGNFDITSGSQAIFMSSSSHAGMNSTFSPSFSIFNGFFYQSIPIFQVEIFLRY